MLRCACTCLRTLRKSWDAMCTRLFCEGDGRHDGSDAPRSVATQEDCARARTTEENESTSACRRQRMLTEDEALRDSILMALQRYTVDWVSTGNVDRQCSICLERIEAKERVRALACMHVYHDDCIASCFLYKRCLDCPECQKETHAIQSSDVYVDHV